MEKLTKEEQPVPLYYHVSSQVKVYHLANAKVYHPPIGLLNG